MRTTPIIAAPIAAALTVLALAGCKAPDGSKASAATPSAGGSSSASENANTPPDPEAKLTGTCDYDLGSGMGANYTLLAEVDIKNTGNIGARIAVKVSWPQFASSPVTATKKVTVPYHRTLTVRFSRHATQTMIDRLQSWQMRHDGDDGCKYSGNILETAGQPH